MTKQTKILIVLFLAAMLALSIFIFLKSDIKNAEIAVSDEKISPEERAANYKKEVKAIINDLFLKLDDDNFSADMARDVRNKLRAVMGVPAEFTDLHLALFIAVTKIEDSLVSGDQEGRLAGKEEIKKIIIDYPWFN